MFDRTAASHVERWETFDGFTVSPCRINTGWLSDKPGTWVLFRHLFLIFQFEMRPFTGSVPILSPAYFSFLNRFFCFISCIIVRMRAWITGRIPVIALMLLDHVLVFCILSNDHWHFWRQALAMSESDIFLLVLDRWTWSEDLLLLFNWRFLLLIPLTHISSAFLSLLFLLGTLKDELIWRRR